VSFARISARTGVVLLTLTAGLTLVQTSQADTGMNITVSEGHPFSGRVATTNCAINSATINWGDGTPTSAGRDAGDPSGVVGDHTYAEEGAYTGTVTYSSSCLRTGLVHFQASVADAQLTATGRDVSGTQGQALSETVAHLADADPGAAASDDTATIIWGDGSSSPGTVTAAGGGGFDVAGAHTYSGSGTYTVTTSIADAGGATATASGRASIAAVTTSTTTTSSTTSSPPSSPPRIVRVTSLAPPAAGAPVVLTAVTDRPATAIEWNLAGDSRPEITCSGAQTAVTFRAAAGARSVTAVAIGPGGSGASLTTSVSIAPSAPLTAAQRRLAGRVRRALGKKAPVYACAAPGDFGLKAVGHRAIPALSDQILLRNCQTPRTVVEAGLQFEGCLREVSTVDQIPTAERGILFPFVKSVGVPGGEAIAIPFNKGKGVDSRVRNLVVQIPDVYITYGKVKINGLTLDPGPDAAIVIAPQMNAVASSDASLSVGSIALQHARSFDMNLNPSAGQIPLGSFARAAGGLADIAGFALGGSVKVTLDDTGNTFGLTIRVHLSLPSFLEMGGVSAQGDVTLRSTNADGLVIDNLRIGPIDAEIGGLGLDSLQLDYTRASQEWAGQGRACIIDGACLDVLPPNGGVVIRNGSLVKLEASLDFPAPGIELFAGVALNRIGFGIGLDPTRLLANAKLTAEGILVIDGHLVLAFPSDATPFILDHSEVDADPAHPAFPADYYNRRYTQVTFAIAANASIDLPLAGVTPFAGAYLLYEAPGYVGLGGGIEAHFAGIIDLSGRVDGEFNFASGRFSIKGDVHVCVADVVCAGAIGAVSDLGAGACVSLGPLNIGGGVRFSPFHLYFWPFDGCRWSPFVDTHVFSAREPRTAAAGRSIPVTIKRGAASRAIELDGVGGAPSVRVQTPEGKVLTSSAASGLALSPAIRIIRSQRFDTTVVGLVHPVAGTYTIELLSGSPGVKKMSQASDQPKARISALVRGTGARRTLIYNIGPRRDQRVRFVEQIAHGGSRIIAAIRGGGRGRLSFTPAPGNDRRTVIAQFELAGLPAETVKVASFAPPPPHLGKVLSLRVSRRALSLHISWGAVPGATGYEVVGRLAAGSERFVRTRRRSISLGHVARFDHGLISVRAVAPQRHGKPAIRRVSAAGRTPTRLGPVPRPPRRR
jgi:hypothetical protein